MTSKAASITRKRFVLKLRSRTCHPICARRTSSTSATWISFACSTNSGFTVVPSERNSGISSGTENARDRDGVYKRRDYWHHDYKDPRTGRWRSRTTGKTSYNDAKADVNISNGLGNLLLAERTTPAPSVDGIPAQFFAHWLRPWRTLHCGLQRCPPQAAVVPQSLIVSVQSARSFSRTLNRLHAFADASVSGHVVLSSPISISIWIQRKEIAGSAAPAERYVPSRPQLTFLFYRRFSQTMFVE